MRLAIALAALLLAAAAADAGEQDVRIRPCRGAVDAYRFTTNTTNGAQQLTSKANACAVTVQASCANGATDVEVGDSAVDVSSATDDSRGWVLKACDSITLPVDNPSRLYVDSGTAAATVRVLVVLGP